MTFFSPWYCFAAIASIVFGVSFLPGCAHTMLATGWPNETGIKEIFATTERITLGGWPVSALHGR